MKKKWQKGNTWCVFTSKGEWSGPNEKEPLFTEKHYAIYTPKPTTLEDLFPNGHKEVWLHWDSGIVSLWHEGELGVESVLSCENCRYAHEPKVSWDACKPIITK